MLVVVQAVLEVAIVSSAGSVCGGRNVMPVMVVQLVVVI